MNRPQIESINTALKIYYENSEIGNKEIISLFGKLSSATLSKLKKIVKNKMIEDGMPSYSAYKINTKIAFDVWGINVDDLEERWRKLNKLNLV